MRTLVIDSATEACSAALSEEGRLIAGAYAVIGRGHAEQLVPMIAGLPEKGRAGRIAVSLGPGSFTGVRIGLAAARALSLAWSAPVVGYPTLALVAAMARESHPGAVTVCMTGGHGQWFVQGFDAEGLPQAEPASLAPEDARGAAAHAIVAGNQAEALVRLRGTGLAMPLLPDARCWNLLPIALLTETVGPLYGRAPDARLLA